MSRTEHSYHQIDQGFIKSLSYDLWNQPTGRTMSRGKIQRNTNAGDSSDDSRYGSYLFGTMTQKRKASKATTRRTLIDETSESDAGQAGNFPSGSLEEYQIETSDTDGTRITREKTKAQAEAGTATSAQAPQSEEGAREEH
ncbi:hypothetical protein HAX54_030102 [Datura stramonium]|uniref:Uncharacterized protein n=1 Tax=Datura stramonium TaxID=4076 RepID=A0ABS8V825_DATST|nr:hypothetical protein [Datura stramonium]